MERNKWEKRMKEQLQGREISPSKAAWNRISRELEAHEKASAFGRWKKTKRFSWYGIAAGFIGILFVSVLYLTNEESSAVPETEITDREMETPTVHQRPAIVGEEKIPEDHAVSTAEGQEAKSNTNDLRRNQDGPHMSEPVNKAVAGFENGHERLKKATLPATPTEKILHREIAEVVAQVEVLERKNTTITDAEIDSLLRNAQQQILEDDIFRKDRSVDAMALLADVEDELDRSFRDQLFEALKDGFLKVRTAVADRNE